MDASVKEGNNDIILAQIMANFTKKGYDYYKSQSSEIKANDSDVPEITVYDIPSSIRGLEITLNKREATVGIDPVELDVAPFAENGRTMVPIKFISETLGFIVKWDPINQSISVNNNPYYQENSMGGEMVE